VSTRTRITSWATLLAVALAVALLIVAASTSIGSLVVADRARDLGRDTRARLDAFINGEPKPHAVPQSLIANADPPIDVKQDGMVTSMQAVVNELGHIAFEKGQGEVFDGLVKNVGDSTKSLQEKVGDSKTGSTTLFGAVEGVDDDLFSLDGKVDTLDGKVDTLDGKVDTLDGKVDTVDGKVDTLDGKVGGSLSTSTTTLFGAVNGVSTAVAGVNGAIGDVQDVVQTLNGAIGGTTNGVNTAITSISVVQQNIGKSNDAASVPSLFGVIKSLDDRLGAIATKIDGVETLLEAATDVTTYINQGIYALVATPGLVPNNKYTSISSYLIKIFADGKPFYARLVDPDTTSPVTDYLVFTFDNPLGVKIFDPSVSNPTTYTATTNFDTNVNTKMKLQIDTDGSGTASSYFDYPSTQPTGFLYYAYPVKLGAAPNSIPATEWSGGSNCFNTANDVFPGSSDDKAYIMGTNNYVVTVVPDGSSTSLPDGMIASPLTVSKTVSDHVAGTSVGALTQEIFSLAPDFNAFDVLSFKVELSCASCTASDYGVTFAERVVTLAQAPIKPKDTTYIIAYDALVSDLKLGDVVEAVRGDGNAKVYKELDIEIDATTLAFATLQTADLTADVVSSTTTKAITTVDIANARKSLTTTTMFGLTVKDTSQNTRTYTNALQLTLPYDLQLCTPTTTTSCVKPSTDLNTFFGATDDFVATFTSFSLGSSDTVTVTCTSSSSCSYFPSILNNLYAPSDLLSIQYTNGGASFQLYDGNLQQ